MPSKTPAQAHFMSAVAHSPEFAKKAGVSQKVGKDFHEKDVTHPKHGKRHLIKALRSRSTGGTTSGTAIGGGTAGGGAGGGS
jgi:hypothetical protein